MMHKQYCVHATTVSVQENHVNYELPVRTHAPPPPPPALLTRATTSARKATV